MRAVKIAAKILAWLFVIIIMVAVASLVLFAFVFWQMGEAMCGTEIFQEIVSPNGKNKLVLYQRDCGATTGFATHISLIGSNADLPNDIGNVFQARGHPDWFDIQLSWEDDQHAVIEHNGKPIPYLTETKIGRVEFRYVENTSGRLPPRPFPAADLLLPLTHFPPGWSANELRPSGPEEIKGWKENNPYMLYSPTFPDFSWTESAAKYAISREDTVEDAVASFVRARDEFQTYSIAGCATPGTKPVFVFRSQYTTNVYVGFAEHQYADGSGEPACLLYAQYDEFFIRFEATIAENGLTYQQFNDLLLVIDQIMLDHLDSDEHK